MWQSNRYTGRKGFTCGNVEHAAAGRYCLCGLVERLCGVRAVALGTEVLDVHHPAVEVRSLICMLVLGPASYGMHARLLEAYPQAASFHVRI